MSRAIAMLDDALDAIREQAATFVADLVADPFTTIEQVEREDELQAGLSAMSDAQLAAACTDPIFEAYGVRSRDCCGHACECDQDADEPDTNELTSDEESRPSAAAAPAAFGAVERGPAATGERRRGKRGGRRHGGPDDPPRRTGPTKVTGWKPVPQTRPDDPPRRTGPTEADRMQPGPTEATG